MRIKNKEQLIGHGNKVGREYIAKILEAGMQAADPYYNTLDLLEIKGDELHVGNDEFAMDGAPFRTHDEYNRKDIDRIYIFGAGKGILSVVKALEERLGDWLTDGYVIAKYGDDIITERVHVKLAAHPVPDQNCVDGCAEMVQMIKDARLTERDLVFTIVGNGMSSLLTYPAEGLNIDDVSEVTRYLQIECGAGTGDVNKIRNCVDRLKSGRISRMLIPAKMIHILAIDTGSGSNATYNSGWRNSVDTFLHTLQSGGVSPKLALGVLEHYNAVERMPKISEYLEKMSEEKIFTPEEFEVMDVRIYGVLPRNRSMPKRVEDTCRSLGLTPYVFLPTTGVEASAMGRVMALLARTVEKGEAVYKAPCVLINYGEMVVTVDKGTGVGGRNQEFTLSGALVIGGSERIVMGAVDTDGTDGPGGNFDEEAYLSGVRNLAGGITDGYTVNEAASEGVDISLALRNHDTSRALWKLNSGVYAVQCVSINDIALTLIME